MGPETKDVNRLTTPAPDDDPALQRVIVQSRAQRHLPLLSRERIVEGGAVVLFLLLAGGLAFSADHRPLDVPLALAMTCAYALSTRVEFRTGSGCTDASQLVFVPMLFVLPAATVPVLVAVALLSSRVPDYLRGEVALERLPVRVNDAWYSLAPALVFTLAGVGAPTWEDAPIYALALASQLVTDFLMSGLRAWGAGVRVPPRTLLSEMGAILGADALIAPVGLLVAFAAVAEPWNFLLVLPLLALFRVLAHEREARIEGALTLSSAYRGTAHLLGELLSASHEYTGAHSHSVVLLSHQVAARLGVDERTMRDVEFGALLHDVGKLSVPNEIINKPGALTDEEWELMRQHTREGEGMLGRIGGILGDVGAVVRSHHERWDGTGYPDGLAGSDIPLASRIISACDAFNAMTTDRPYRAALSLDAAIEELRANAGTQFDPAVVDCLVELVLADEAEARRAADHAPDEIAPAAQETLKPAGV
jgi:hypothetical protein